MKKVSKKILAGTIAAAFLVGGAGLLHITQANADTTSKSTSTSTQENDSDNHEHGKYGHGNNVIQEVATIVGVTDQTTLRDQLKQGKTLAQIAKDKGVTEDVLLQKLTAAETQNIDAAVTAGKLTQAQADKKKSELAARLKKEVESTKQNEGHEKGFEGRGFVDQAALAKIFGITQQELKNDLQSGQSLAQIAQSKNITEDQLISGIKDSMTDRIKQFVEKKDQPETGDTPDAPSAGTTSTRSTIN